MRKIVFSGFVAIACLNACNNRPKVASAVNDESKRNLEVSHIVSQAFQTGDVSKLDSVVSTDFVDHTDRGDMKGIDSLKASVNWIRENLKDMRAEVRREWADTEYVSSWMRYTGNNPTAMPGFPVGPYEWNTIELSKYRDGKLIEHWGFMDAQTVMKMMQPAAVKAATRDSSAKRGR